VVHVVFFLIVPERVHCSFPQMRGGRVVFDSWFFILNDMDSSLSWFPETVYSFINFECRYVFDNSPLFLSEESQTGLIENRKAITITAITIIVNIIPWLVRFIKQRLKQTFRLFQDDINLIDNSHQIVISNWKILVHFEITWKP